MDFQFDSTVDGRAVKIASMIDEHTRESLLHLVERCTGVRHPGRPEGAAVRQRPLSASRSLIHGDSNLSARLDGHDSRTAPML
ncbi:hypothetical protein [Nocardia abscessus]|uniref:hypothetical protein n=1 Tax=Nocardia abscessus TaxID=120957 RepID=UPI003CC7C886